MSDILSKVTIGSDPELFLREAGSGKLISAVGLIGGTKYDPRPLGDYFVQEDNVAVEFNIPPCKTVEEFDLHIHLAMDAIKRELPPDLELAVLSSGIFTEDQLDTPEARMFGCDPDYNAWSGLPNRVFSNNPNLRSCGGHIHIGFEGHSLLDAEVTNLTKALDLFTAVPSVLLDNDTLRRELYGKAGCYRVKPYGVEYRTLSNFWVKTPELRRWVFESTIAAIKFVDEGRSLDDMGKLIEQTVNHNDHASAVTLIDYYNLKVA